MNREDYNKFYIQGSDHYLIPKDVFDELFDEMSNWREEVKELNQKYLNAVADYETTMAEKEQINSLVNSCQEEIRRLKKQLEEKENIACNWKDSCLENVGKIEELENQQKEFVKYLEKTIVDSKAGSGQQYYYQQVLEMYKEIIGSK